MELSNIVKKLEIIAPTHLAEKWDNVGLLTSPSTPQPIQKILLTNDLTTRVLSESLKKEVHLIIPYHPPLFSSLKRLTPSNPRDRILLTCIENKIALYSPHTSCDTANGGVNDWLAKSLEENNNNNNDKKNKNKIRTVKPFLQDKKEVKIVCFCPEEAKDKVRQAMTDAGAGKIGDYTDCTFESEGQGHFTPSSSSNPYIGSQNKHETVKEVKIETVCPISKLENVLEALKKSHPYETPAYDLYSLQPTPLSGTGQGRFIELSNPRPLSEVIKSIKKYVGMETCQFSLSMKEKSIKDHIIKTVALCAGSGAEVILNSGADLLLTGEMRHHDVLAAIEKGSSVVLLNHSNSERGFLKDYREKLYSLLSNDKIDILISETDKDPLEFI